MKNIEIWKSIANYYGFYEVSTLGRVRSLDSTLTTKKGVIRTRFGRVMSLNKKKNGYLSVMFSINENKKRFYAHRLVAISFIDNIENKTEVNHINGIKNDNRVENLEWVTKSENSIHAIKNGLIQIGQYSTSSKLKDLQIIAIRRLFKINPNFNKVNLAKKLGVSDATIHKIIRNQSRKYSI